MLRMHGFGGSSGIGRVRCTLEIVVEMEREGNGRYGLEE
jgi:hypothetical protein